MAGKLCIHIVWNASSNIRHCYDIKLAANECKTNILTVEGCTHLMTTPREVHDTIVCFILPQFIPQCSNQLIYILFFSGLWFSFHVSAEQVGERAGKSNPLHASLNSTLPHIEAQSWWMQGWVKQVATSILSNGPWMVESYSSRITQEINKS